MVNVDTLKVSAALRTRDDFLSSVIFQSGALHTTTCYRHILLQVLRFEWQCLYCGLWIQVPLTQLLGEGFHSIRFRHIYHLRTAKKSIAQETVEDWMYPGSSLLEALLCWYEVFLIREFTPRSTRSWITSHTPFPPSHLRLSEKGERNMGLCETDLFWVLKYACPSVALVSNSLGWHRYRPWLLSLTATDAWQNVHWQAAL